MSRGALVLVLCAAAAGGAIGFVVGHGAPPPPAPVEPQRGDEPPAPRDLVHRAGPVRSDPGGLEPLDVPSGRGVLTGSVTTAAGRPLAGAVVRAILATAPRQWTDGAPPTAEEDALAILEARRRVGSRREAITGEDGSFRIDRLADRAYRVEAYKRGYTIRSENAERTRPGGIVDFAATLRILVPVDVRLPEGGEPVEARITVGGQRRQDYGPFGYAPGIKPQTWLPDRRTVALEPGTYSLTASAGLHGEMRSEKVSVTVREGETPEEVLLELRRRPGVRGRMRFADGVVEPGNMLVSCLRWKGEAEPSVEEYWQGRPQQTSAGRGFAFVFADLEPGRYRLAALVGWQVRASESVTVAEGMVEQDIVVPPPEAGEFLLVNVLDPGGEPVDGATFQLGIREEGKPGWNSSVTAARLPGGPYRVRIPKGARKGRPGGRAFLTALSTGLGAREVEVDPDDPTPITVSFDEPGRLTVRVEGARPGQADDIHVSLNRMSNGKSAGSAVPGGSSGSLEKDGSWTCEGLQAGRYELAVWIKVSTHGNVPVAKRTIDLGPGKNVESVGLPGLHALTILVDEDHKGWIRLVGDDMGTQYGAHLGQPSEGRLEIRNLPAGRYGLMSRSGRDSLLMPITVPGASEIRFVGSPPKAMRVRIRDEDGLLARAGLQTGDLLIGVNGEEFEGTRDMQGKLLIAGQKDPAKLIVLRGGRRLVVPFDVSALEKRRQDLGGWLEQATR